MDHRKHLINIIIEDFIRISTSNTDSFIIERLLQECDDNLRNHIYHYVIKKDHKSMKDPIFILMNDKSGN